MWAAVALSAVAGWIIERILYFAAPLALTRLAVLRIDLARRLHLSPAAVAGAYRYPALTHAGAAPKVRFRRVDAGEGVLLLASADGRTVAVRPAFRALAARTGTLVRIDLHKEGSDLVLTPRQVVHATDPISVAVWGLVLWQYREPLLWVLTVATAAAVLWSYWRSLDERDRIVLVALGRIELDLREAGMLADG